MSVVGGIVTDVRATTYLFETQNVDDPEDKSAAWLTAGLWLATDCGDLHVFNALDENGVAAKRPERDAAHDWRPV
ncbi:Xin repeat protein [Nocardioides sp. J9]|nr:Xin repeat protein [Nocardioides sp. J9]